jgi:ABC-type polysaccharide transport system, permease component
MLIMSLGSMFSVGYEKIILMYNTSTYETADVINTYVYRRGIVNSEYSFGTAVGLFQSAINFILVVIVNKVSRKLSEISLW